MAEHFDVFMSSTSRDLPEYRKALMDIITAWGMFPIAMEHFQPTADNALQVCYDAVQEAEIFVGLYAFRYGFAPPATMTYTRKDGTLDAGDGVTGITEWEYKWAIERGIPILLFVVENDAQWKQSDVEKGVGAERLEAFKNRITGVHVVKFFKNQAEFERQVSIALGSTKQNLLDKRLSESALQPRSAATIAEAEKSALTVANSQLLQSRQETRNTLKKVGILPKRFDDNSFHDRTDQQAQINNVLLNGGVVSVYGQGGVGKTGLVCKVLGDLEKRDTALDGRIFMKAEDASSLTIDHIINNFAKILPTADLPIGQASISLSAREKTEMLLEALSGGRYLLVIDNAESLQDDAHKLIDPALQTFLETVLETGGNDALTVLITGRYPIPFKALFKAHERKIMLTDGLPAEDARQFLRQLDDQQRLPGDDQALDRLIERVRGFPRALEASVGWLGNNSTSTLAHLLADLPNIADVTPYLVEKAQDSLPPAFQQVLQAVALAGIGLSGQGVPQTTLEYLLAPYLDVAQLPALLNRLVQARFLLFNETTRTYTLHPYDRVHALAQIPQSADEWSYGALNERMADFYARQRVSEPQSLADLEPQLHEFEHRLANHDYDTAAQLLVQIDFKFLLLWGYVELMLTLHTRLEGKISNPGLAGISAGNLGMAYRNMGQVEKAIGYYEKALAMARQQNHRQGEGTWLGNLGIAYSDLGQVEKAIAYYLQAIEIARDSKDRRGEGGWFGNLGNAYYQLGKVEKAIITYLQALEIAREMKDRRGEGVCISNLGNAYLNLGEFEKAIEYYLQALENTRESKNRSGECTRLGNLGEAYTALKQYDRAIPLIQQAVAIAEEIKSPTNSQYKNMQLAKSYLYSGDVAQALTTIRKARTYDVPENNHAVALLQGVVALHAGERQEAQDAFADSLRLADELLAKTPNLYEALYDRALAHVGVLACGGSDDHLASARADVAKARAIFAGAGILNDKKRLLEALCQAAGQIWEIGL